MSFLTLLLSGCTLGIALAQEPAAPTPTTSTNPMLSFPLEKNRVKILPQRFEYQLIDKDHVRIGDIVMDANEIGLQIVSEAFSRGRYKVKFTWPAGLLAQGEIAIKDDSGKAIWIHKIDTTKIQFAKPKNADDSVRAAIASYETSTNVTRLVREIQKFPFFQFCVHREEPLTKIYICSKDLYVKKDKGSAKILARDSYRPQSYVEINGKPVGPQGLILLNSEEEFVSLRALLLSGANIELDTRVRAVQFNDVVLSPDGQQITIRAEGAEPVDPTTVKKLNDAGTKWEATLDIGRPYTYLKGQGDLPLRQEFVMQGNVRKEDVQVEITSSAPEKVYSGSLTLGLKPAEGLSLLPADPDTVLRKQRNGYQWTLKNLKPNEVNRRLIKVRNAANEDFIAAYDVERLNSMEAKLSLNYPLWTDFNFLWTPFSAWDVHFAYNLNLNKDDVAMDSIAFTKLGARYRLPGGVRLRDKAYYVELQAQQFKSPLGSDLFYAAEIGVESPVPSWLGNYFQWGFISLNVPLMTSNSNTTLESTYEFSTSVRHTGNSAFFWETGVVARGMRMTKKETTTKILEYSTGYVFVTGGFNF